LPYQQNEVDFFLGNGGKRRNLPSGYLLISFDELVNATENEPQANAKANARTLDWTGGQVRHIRLLVDWEVEKGSGTDA